MRVLPVWVWDQNLFPRKFWQITRKGRTMMPSSLDCLKIVSISLFREQTTDENAGNQPDKENNS